MTTALLEKTQAEEKALTIPERATAFIVSSNEEYAKGEEFMSLCKQLETEIHEAWDDTVKKADAAHKSAVASRKKYLDPLETGRKILKQKMIAYQDECERIRREEQRRLELEAKKRAEEEALALAEQLALEGNQEAAEEVLTAPLDVAPIIAPKAAPQASRLTAGRSVWSAEVVSLMTLIKAVAAGQQPIALLMVNQPALNNAAKLIKVNGSTAIPGCKVIERRV